jgi:hypothetical protein
VVIKGGVVRHRQQIRAFGTDVNTTPDKQTVPLDASLEQTILQYMVD